MNLIQLWAVENSGEHRAVPIDSIANSETEQLLEDLLVESPDLLIPGLALVGRQLSTEGGPLDLLGVDQDGRLIVFELKRGTLTRDAIAQVLDYASDLAVMDADRFARLIEEGSGSLGIDRFDNFLDWYVREYPNATDPLSESPRMVLVGLGVDERARRIVNFLAESGIDIQLLTFHAFRSNGQMFLARQVESETPSGPSGGSAATKAGNRKILHGNAQELGVEELLEDVAGFVTEHVPAAYRWPGTTSYSYNLPEQTSEGRPTQRSYATLYLDQKRRGSLLLTFPPRAVDAAGQSAVEQFCDVVSDVERPQTRYVALEVRITRSSWGDLKEALSRLLADVVRGWEERSAAQQHAGNGE